MKKEEYITILKENLNLPSEYEKDILKELDSHFTNSTDPDYLKEFGDPKELAKSMNKTKNTSLKALFKLPSTYYVIGFDLLVFLLMYFIIEVIVSFFFSNVLVVNDNIINGIFAFLNLFLCVFLTRKSAEKFFKSTKQIYLGLVMIPVLWLLMVVLPVIIFAFALQFFYMAGV